MFMEPWALGACKPSPLQHLVREKGVPPKNHGRADSGEGGGGFFFFFFSFQLKVRCRRPRFPIDAAFLRQS